MPERSLPSGRGPSVRPCVEARYREGSIVFHFGFQSGLIAPVEFRINSHMCPPPSRTETCPQVLSSRKPVRPSKTLDRRVIEVEFFLLLFGRGDLAAISGFFIAGNGTP